MALNFPFRKISSDSSDAPNTVFSDKDFSESINLFKTQRKKVDISLEQLSIETKISRNVLIAIENGWKKYLPEPTYLISMIKILEVKLNLERGSLNGLVERKVSLNNISRFQFNFINIDFLNSWTGSLFYFIFMLLSILALNSQLKYLIKINSISTETILIKEKVIKNGTMIINQKEN